MHDQSSQERRIVSLLSQLYPTPEDVAEEASCLMAQLMLPRETELFASDVHGEHDAFSHLVRNGSGLVRDLIATVFGDDPHMDDAQRAELATLVCYPREKAACKLDSFDMEEEGQAWLVEVTVRLAMLVREASKRHLWSETVSRIEGALPALVEELASQGPGHTPQGIAMIAAASEYGAGIDLAESLALLIQRLLVDRIHLLGDVYDRGPAPQLIMEELMGLPNVDVQWGNHDIVWMGAALGQRGCIAHVVRNCARYGNLSILEDAYGINLRPLAAFATRAYANDPCESFALKGNPGLSPEETELNVKIQKAMAVLQFKVEAHLIDQHPEYGLEDRKLLDKIDRANETVVVDGVEYAVTDTFFPTVDWANPYALTPEEEAVMDQLSRAFQNSMLLQRHMAFLLERGSLYKVSNGNLLLHACVPLNPDGSLKSARINGTDYKGRALYDVLDDAVRRAFESEDAAERAHNADLLWYMWLGQASPLFAKSKMATFEIYLIEDKAARKEVKNPFYTLLDDAAVLDGIFEDFGLDPKTARLICGHVPVKAKDGEDPVKAGGRVLMIDGGFSSAYQKTTGLAGYTLVSDAHGMFLDANTPLASRRAAIEDDVDIIPQRRVIERHDTPLATAFAERGVEIGADLAELALLHVERDGGEGCLEQLMKGDRA